MSPCTSRKDLVQEARSFVGSRDSTRFMLAKQAVANPGNESVTQIAQRKWDQPQNRAQQPPDSAECHQNATDCGSPSKVAFGSMKHQRGEILSKVSRYILLGRRSLKWCELNALRSVSQQNPVHRVITEATHAIKKEDVRRWRGGIGHDVIVPARDRSCFRDSSTRYRCRELTAILWRNGKPRHCDGASRREATEDSRSTQRIKKGAAVNAAPLCFAGSNHFEAGSH